MVRKSIRLTGWAIAAALALVASPRLSAQDTTTSKNHLYDKWTAGASFTTVLNNSSLRVDGPGGNFGTEINVRRDLGISGSSVQPALALAWKPGRRTEFDLGYQFINNSGERTLTEDLVIGNDTVSADLVANSKVGSSIASLAFKYSIFAAERHIIGVELGLGAIFYDFQLDATANGCVGTACDSGAVNVKQSTTLPTVALGVFGQWRLGDRWYLGGDVRGLGGTVAPYTVSIFQADAYTRYFFSDRWGAGLAWYYNNVTVDVAAKDGATAGDGNLNLGGKLSFDYTSLRLGVIAAF